MGLRENVSDPWGALVAVLAGGLTWAVIPGAALAIPLGLAVAAAVFVAKVGAAALIRRNQDEPGDREFLQPRKGSAAEVWLSRAEKSVRTLDELVDTAGEGATRDRLRDVESEASVTVGTLRRLAGQVTAFEQAMSRIPMPSLEDERTRLQAAVRHADNDELRSENVKALGSVDQQLDIYRRLSSARETLLARMQSTTLGLEGLNARTAELLALSTSTGATSDEQVIEELSGTLEGMRAGLVEVEELSRRVLQPGGSLPPPTPA